MIILEFLYRGTTIKVIPFKNLEFTKENRQKLRDEIKAGLIPKPANYDLIAFHPSQTNHIQLTNFTADAIEAYD